MERIPIVIDCDPGVDDSFAIALANAHPGFELRALTAVEGNVPAAVTRRNLLCLADEFDLSCRVAFGAELPLKKPYTVTASQVHGAGGLGDIVFPEPRRRPDDRPAWDVIYEEAVRAEGRLVLFATGPLTNIAQCLRAHPDLPRYLADFCIMGGGTFGNMGAAGQSAEFNIWVDPDAAEEVFEKLTVRMVGLNATHAAALRPEELDEMIAICSRTERNWFLRRLTEFSKRNSQENGMDNHIIHDALAVAAVIEPGLVTFRDCHVRVETDPAAPNHAQTVIDETGEPKNAHVAMAVDQPGFFRLLTDMCRFYNGER